MGPSSLGLTLATPCRRLKGLGNFLTCLPPFYSLSNDDSCDASLKSFPEGLNMLMQAPPVDDEAMLALILFITGQRFTAGVYSPLLSFVFLCSKVRKSLQPVSHPFLK